MEYFIDRHARQQGTQFLKQPGVGHRHLLRIPWLEAAVRMVDGLLQGLCQCFAGVIGVAHRRGPDRAAAIHHQGEQRPDRLPVIARHEKGIRAMPISQVPPGLVPKPLGRCRGGAMAMFAVAPC
jgi:hypothetical protein